jgi:hypothetical protein
MTILGSELNEAAPSDGRLFTFSERKSSYRSAAAAGLFFGEHLAVGSRC